ncbi:MAG: hypothetical protein LBU32_16850 [Clostridiales bacterium]|nr:hypothetical protein [Clostridiales bacterium]
MPKGKGIRRITTVMNRRARLKRPAICASLLAARWQSLGQRAGLGVANAAAVARLSETRWKNIESGM